MKIDVAELRRRGIRVVEHGQRTTVVDSAVGATIAMRTKNELNMHEHWRNRANRARDQKCLVKFELGKTGVCALPVLVKLTRIAPSRGLDPHDGLPASLKFVADAVAEMYGIDDRDPRLSFAYAQERGEYAVRVVIRPR